MSKNHRLPRWSTLPILPFYIIVYYGYDLYQKNSWLRGLSRGLVRLVIPIGIGAVIASYFYRILSKPELWEKPLTIGWWWTIPMALSYLCGHSLWGLFGFKLLQSQGLEKPRSLALSAYFISQFGKYVPGKIWVVLLRTRMLKPEKSQQVLIAILVTLETLTSMASGAFVGILILPLLETERLGFSQPLYWLLPISGLPLGLIILVAFARKMIEKRFRDYPGLLPKITFSLILRGLCQTSIGWFLLGISIYCGLCAVLPQIPPWDSGFYLRLTGITAFAYVLGFAALFMPAGSGVRELILQLFLTQELLPIYDQEQSNFYAVITVLLVRLIWTVAELILAFSLLMFSKKKSESSGDASPSSISPETSIVTTHEIN